MLWQTFGRQIEPGMRSRHAIGSVPQMLVTMIDDDPFVGRIATGRLASGVVKVGDRVKIIRRDGAALQ